jgi:hypothetical protein
MNKIRATKKFVTDHKVAIAVTLTAALCLKLNKMALKDHDNFLKEHDLYDTFYNAE